MDNGPDYENLRSETAFRWYVSSPFYVFLGLGGHSHRRDECKAGVDNRANHAGQDRFLAHWPE
jgi:hypothetical protein